MEATSPGKLIEKEEEKEVVIEKDRDRDRVKRERERQIELERGRGRNRRLTSLVFSSFHFEVYLITCKFISSLLFFLFQSCYISDVYPLCLCVCDSFSFALSHIYTTSLSLQLLLPFPHNSFYFRSTMRWYWKARKRACLRRWLKWEVAWRDRSMTYFKAWKVKEEWEGDLVRERERERESE